MWVDADRGLQQPQFRDNLLRQVLLPRQRDPLPRAQRPHDRPEEVRDGNTGRLPFRQQGGGAGVRRSLLPRLS